MSENWGAALSILSIKYLLYYIAGHSIIKQERPNIFVVLLLPIISNYKTSSLFRFTVFAKTNFVENCGQKLRYEKEYKQYPPPDCLKHIGRNHKGISEEGQ